MDNILSKEKEGLIRSIAKDEGFTKFNIKVTSGSMKGDGYLGIIQIANIIDLSNPNKTLNVIIKSAMVEEAVRQNAPVKKAYEREIFLYETIFPEFRQLSIENNVKNQFTETVKCYGSLLLELEECIVLENLKEINFQLWNRKLPMNEDHVSLVFTTYGKFHATGIALKLLKPERYEELGKNLVNIFYNEEETEQEQKIFQGTLKHIFGSGFAAVSHHENATKALRKFAQNCQQFFKEDVRRIDKYSTILHGDCWCNNMMFKYEDRNNPAKPTEMRLLDWQISNLGSPVLDLAYFFCACSSKEVLYKIESFLRIYHTSFLETAKEFGLKSEDILSFDELLEQWKLYSKFGLFMALFITKAMLSEVDEAPDLRDIAKSGKNVVEFFADTKSVNHESINQRIADVVIFMSDCHYL